MNDRHTIEDTLLHPGVVEDVDRVVKDVGTLLETYKNPSCPICGSPVETQIADAVVYGYRNVTMIVRCKGCRIISPSRNNLEFPVVSGWKYDFEKSIEENLEDAYSSFCQCIVEAQKKHMIRVASEESE